MVPIWCCAACGLRFSQLVKSDLVGMSTHGSGVVSNAVPPPVSWGVDQRFWCRFECRAASELVEVSTQCSGVVTSAVLSPA